MNAATFDLLSTATEWVFNYERFNLAAITKFDLPSSIRSDRRLVALDGVDGVQPRPDGAEVRPRQPGAAALLRQPGTPLGRRLLPGRAHAEEQVRDRLQG